MTAQIINIADYLPRPHLRLRWHALASRQWRLVNAADVTEVWATIEPYGDGKRHGRGIFARPTVKATCTHPDLRGGEAPWVMASTVQQAKRRIMGYISAHADGPFIISEAS